MHFLTNTTNTANRPVTMDNAKQTRHAMNTPDNQAPRNAVDAILQARMTAAAAEQSANVCRMKAHQMEQTLSENTQAYMNAMRRYHHELDKINHMVEVTQVSSTIVLIFAILILFFTILEMVA